MLITVTDQHTKLPTMPEISQSVSQSINQSIIQSNLNTTPVKCKPPPL